MGGSTAGAVQTGSLKGAVSGAISSGVFFGIGSAFSYQNAPGLCQAEKTTPTFSGHAVKALSHGVAGGVMAHLQGGRFGHGFLAAGSAKRCHPRRSGATARASLWGRRSRPRSSAARRRAWEGGKFANGAVTAAFGYAFGAMASDGLHDGSGLMERTDAGEIKRIAASATAEANQALGDLIGRRYETMDSAALAWSDAISPVSEKYNTEIASRFFKSGRGYAFGSATSDGLIKSVDPAGSLLKGGLLTTGYIHTHPTTALFSPNDLDYAVGMYKRANSGWFAGGIDQSAFVAVRGGAVYRWSVNEYISSGGASWMNSSYYHRVRP